MFEFLPFSCQTNDLDLDLSIPAKQIKKHKLKYFSAVWNVLDVVILLIAYVCIIFNIYRQVKVNELLQTILANDNQYIDFEFLCYWQTQFNNAVAGMVFIAWIKVSVHQISVPSGPGLETYLHSRSSNT